MPIFCYNILVVVSMETGKSLKKICLDEYKEYLINYYVYEYDNNDVRKEERRKYLDTFYSDDYLQKVIDDTYTFTYEIINSNLDKGYLMIPLEEDITSYLSLNLVGAWPSDIIFDNYNGLVISKYILKQVFGNKFNIKVESEEYEVLVDDIGSIYYKYYLYIDGISNVKEIKESLFGIEKVLKKEAKASL